MNEYARSGLALLTLTAAMCGAVIVATAPLRRRMEELEQRNPSRRTP